MWRTRSLRHGGNGSDRIAAVLVDDGSLPVNPAAGRLSPESAARHPTDMANESERSLMVTAGVRVVQRLARVTVMFACVFVSYLASGIPSGTLTDQSAPPS